MSRRSTREQAFRLVYQLEFVHDDPDNIYNNYLFKLFNVDEYEKRIIYDELLGVYENMSEIDEIISHNSKWALNRLNKIDLALIRLGIYELLYEKNKTPIVVSEIVNLASRYGSKQSANFVNGILAVIASDIDSGELNPNDDFDFDF